MSLRAILKGGTGSISKEADCNDANLLPGHLMVLDATGKAIRNNVAFSEVAVAEENHWIGKGLTDTYAVGDRVEYKVLKNGAEFQALVAAGATAITLNAYVKPDPTNYGCVMLAAQPADNALIIGKAMVALDNSAGGSAARLRVEVKL